MHSVAHDLHAYPLELHICKRTHLHAVLHLFCRVLGARVVSTCRYAFTYLNTTDDVTDWIWHDMYTMAPKLQAVAVQDLRGQRCMRQPQM